MDSQAIFAPFAPFSTDQGLVLSDFMEVDYNELLNFREPALWNTTDLVYRSREPSVVAPTEHPEWPEHPEHQQHQQYQQQAEPSEPPEPQRYPSAEDWKKIRPVFTNLYSTEDKTLKDVKEIIERDHGFVATYVPIIVPSHSRH